MPRSIEERIRQAILQDRVEGRMRTFASALAKDPARAGCTDLDNWLEAERRLAAGSVEDDGARAPGAVKGEPVGA